MKQFNQIPVEYDAPHRVEVNGRRHYTDGVSVVPSVTTVLGSIEPGKFDWWYEAIGRDRAESIVRNSAARGTKIHKLAENFTNNKHLLQTDNEVKSFDIESVSMYRNIHRKLHEHVDNVRLSEAMVMSSRLGVGGTLDLLAEWDGKLSVIDFKNARRFKKKEEITDYFIQETMYALMVRENIGLYVEQIVTLITVENSREAQVFIESPTTYFPLVSEILERYKEIQNVV